MGRVVGIREVCAGLVLGALGQAGVAAAEPALDPQAQARAPSNSKSSAF